MRGEIRRPNETKDTMAPIFGSGGVEKQDRRGSKQLEPFQQGLVELIIGGNVCAQQNRLCKHALDVRMLESIALKMLALDTPVGVEIEHHRSFLFARLPQAALETANALN